MPVNLGALSVVHPQIGESVQDKLPHLAVVTRPETANVETVGDAALGYNGPQLTVGATPVGSFPCQFGPYRGNRGDQQSVLDAKKVTLPYEVVLSVSDACQIEVNDKIHIGDLSFVVVLPAGVSSFATFAGVVCQWMR